MGIYVSMCHLPLRYVAHWFLVSIVCPEMLSVFWYIDVVHVRDFQDTGARPGLIITSSHLTFVRSISLIDRSFVAVTGHYVKGFRCTQLTCVGFIGGADL